jgi:hypothetical protein
MVREKALEELKVYVMNVWTRRTLSTTQLLGGVEYLEETNMETRQIGYNEAVRALKNWKKAARICQPSRSIQNRFPDDWKEYLAGWSQAIRELESEMCDVTRDVEVKTR